MRKRTKTAAPTEAARDWPVAAVAATGFAISLYLAINKLAGASALFCEAGTGCDIVQASRWASFLGVPTAGWGALLYAAVVALALTGLPPRRWTWAFALATAAVAFSAYLTWISLFTLQALCPWCVADALVAVALLVVLLVRRPLTGGKRSPTRPARIAAVGVAVAVVTIVGAAGVWVVDPATGTSAYATGLARHLSATGGVMYGAFW